MDLVGKLAQLQPEKVHLTLSPGKKKKGDVVADDEDDDDVVRTNVPQDRVTNDNDTVCTEVFDLGILLQPLQGPPPPLL